MTDRLMTLAAGVLLLALGGCAATPSPSTGAVHQLDTERMAAMEQAASRAGVKIHWVNPPTTRIK